MLTVKSGKSIITSGSSNNQLLVISDGTVECTLYNHIITLNKGDCIGVLDWSLDTYLCSYKALEDVELEVYSFKDTQELLEILEENEQLRSQLMLSSHSLIEEVIKDTRIISSRYKDWYEYLSSLKMRYKIFCKMLGITPKAITPLDNVSSPIATDIISFWANSYYRSIKRLSIDSPSDFDIHMVYGCVYHAAQDMRDYLAYSEKLKAATDEFAGLACNVGGEDIYDMFAELYLKAASAGAELSHIKNVLDELKDKLTNLSPKRAQLFAIKEDIFRHKLTTINANNPNTPAEESTKEQLQDSVNIICDYSGLDAAFIKNFKDQLNLYKSFADRDSSDKDVAACRKALTGLFNQLYTAVVIKALTDSNIPNIIKMFINFGYVDAELAGKDTAVKLFHIAPDFCGTPKHQVYSALQWFQAIYNGAKQPSRNEFDIDYTQHINSLFKEGKIDRATFNNMQDDNLSKVRYELENMFPTVNRMTYGHILTFCPVLTKDHLVKNVDDSLLRPAQVEEYLDRIVAIDYSAFYHEYSFEDRRLSIKEDIYVDIRPDVILMPNVGSHGCLWQEIEGMNRRTPGRMLISSLFVDDAYKAFVHMTAEFRWEMCKREMGGRWNDIASHCLTSDFCDYAQFYAKNREISADTKEKIRDTLRRCRNNFREFFAHEYTIYVMTESEGTFRLNKHSRQLLFKHCPFSRQVREVLRSNSIYQDMIGRHAIVTKQALVKHEHVESRYTQTGNDVPLELTNHKRLLDF